MSCEGNFYEKLLNETNVFDARDWCNKNPSCVGIYDLCGRKNTFSYCKKDDKVVPSKCGSTLYAKGIYISYCLLEPSIFIFRKYSVF